MSYTIVMFPKIQVDTAVAYFLLRNFGEAKFPGITNSPIAFWTELPEGKNANQLEQEGYILIDLGDGQFDHHRLGEHNRKFSASHLIAQYLEIDDKPELRKLLEFARRDDLEGKGTLSSDPIDRSFGLSALITNLNKTIPGKPDTILNLIVPLLEGHYIQERSKVEDMPREYQHLTDDGKVKWFNAVQFGKKLKIAYVHSDNPAMAGYLRSRAVGADMVIQRAGTGHVNFITKQMLRLQLHELARKIKLLEAEKNGLVLPIDSIHELEKHGRTEGLPHWYYDTRANTLQNGGLSPQGIPATLLIYEEIELATKQGLNISREQDKFKPKFRPQRGAIIID